MKIGLLSESEADEAAIRILVEGILGTPTEVCSTGQARNGVSAVFKQLETEIRHVYYRTEAVGLIVVVDSDKGPIPGFEERDRSGQVRQNRLDTLTEIASRTIRTLPDIPGRPPFHVAVGLAIPSVEAWYLCGKDPHINEATWLNDRKQGRFSYEISTLKRRVYGTERPTLAEETEVAKRETQRILRADQLKQLEEAFPAGFGQMAAEIRSWS